VSDTIGHKAEGRWALPGHEFGWPVIAWVGALRYQEHRSVPEIHQALRKRGVEISERTVGHLLNRYDEVLAVSLTDSRRLRRGNSRDGSSWRWTGCNRMWDTRCCGWCGSV